MEKVRYERNVVEEGILGRLITGVLTRRKVIIFLYERLSAPGKVRRTVATRAFGVATGAAGCTSAVIACRTFSS